MQNEHPAKTQIFDDKMTTEAKVSLFYTNCRLQLRDKIKLNAKRVVSIQRLLHIIVPKIENTICYYLPFKHYRLLGWW